MGVAEQLLERGLRVDPYLVHDVRRPEHVFHRLRRHAGRDLAQLPAVPVQHAGRDDGAVAALEDEVVILVLLVPARVRDAAQLHLDRRSRLHGRRCNCAGPGNRAPWVTARHAARPSWLRPGGRAGATCPRPAAADANPLHPSPRIAAARRPTQRTKRAPGHCRVLSLLARLPLVKPAASHLPLQLLPRHQRRELNQILVLLARRHEPSTVAAKRQSTYHTSTGSCDPSVLRGFDACLLRLVWVNDMTSARASALLQRV